MKQQNKMPNARTALLPITDFRIYTVIYHY